ncbi:DUF3995 domain-containing protein [Saccharothrix isguenensis]
MIVASGILLALLLTIAGVLHLLWAAGVMWPFRDERDLLRKVFSDAEALPPNVVTAGVGVALVGAAYLALAGVWTSLRLPFVADWLYVLGLWGLVAVMALRGIVEPIVYIFKPANPDYQRLDRLVYSPLCVLLAVLALVVVI